MYGALGKISWTLILTQAPRIVSSATKLYDTLRKRRTTASASTKAPDSPPSITVTVDEIKSRVESLEQNETTQAELISQIAAQGEALSHGLQVVSARQTLLLWVSGTALVAASIAIVVAILR